MQVPASATRKTRDAARRGVTVRWPRRDSPATNGMTYQLPLRPALWGVAPSRLGCTDRWAGRRDCGDPRSRDRQRGRLLPRLPCRRGDRRAHARSRERTAHGTGRAARGDVGDRRQDLARAGHGGDRPVRGVLLGVMKPARMIRADSRPRREGTGGRVRSESKAPALPHPVPRLAAPPRPRLPRRGRDAW